MAPTLVATPTRWGDRLRTVLAGGAITALYQPIADLRHGSVAGYEAVARFAEPADLAPDRWLAAARRHRVGPAIEALCLSAALGARAELPAGAFLAVNVGPDALLDPSVQAVLAREGDLSGIVLEITEHTPVASYQALLPVLDRYRTRGALVAVDDAGAGYAGLRHLLHLRPAIIKLDRELVTGLDRNEAKRALVEMVAAFAERTEACLLAEGVERREELDALRRLGVPLAQGFLLGTPSPYFTPLSAEAAPHLPASHPARPTETLRDLLEARPATTSVAEALRALLADPGLDLVVLLSPDGRPREIIDGAARHHPRTSAITPLAAETAVADAARRALARPPAARFRPLVCADDAGNYVGVVTMERVLEHLARQAS